MKVIVIGCTHAGTAAIVNMVKLHPDAEITVYERNDNISFLSCGIALYVGGVVQDPAGLFYNSPENLASLGVRTCMKHDVLAADLKQKTVQVKNLESGEEFSDHYDKLVVTSGSWPITPPIPGIEQKNILLAKNYNHARTIIEKTPQARNVVVVGAGYIGVELVEAFRNCDKEVVLIDAMPRILSKYLDAEFTAEIEKTLQDHQIQLALGECVTAFSGQDGVVNAVQTDKGTYAADLVILCIGFRPNTALFRGQLDMLQNGAILVDDYMRTSDPDVLAGGDCCAVHYNPTGRNEYIPLATNAVRMGLLIAHNLKEKKLANRGTQGTSGLRIFDLNIAATGLTEQAAREAGLDVSSTTVIDHERPEFMPTFHSLRLKVVFETGSRRILGAQVLSAADLTQSINTLSIAIQSRMTMEDLALTDFFFQPHYNKPWNWLNAAGLAAL
jgi:NADPH-dependent 2,4-dienoyl-CoA reductase/sulfur reductase-like enzyme